MINGIVSGVDIKDGFRALGLSGVFALENVSRITITSSEVEVIVADRENLGPDGIVPLYTTRFPVRWGDDEFQHAAVSS